MAVRAGGSPRPAPSPIRRSTPRWSWTRSTPATCSPAGARSSRACPAATPRSRATAPRSTRRPIGSKSSTSAPGFIRETPNAAANPPADAENQVSALAARGSSVYAGFCGDCDPVSDAAKFGSGIATNVGGPAAPSSGTPNGWHVAAAHGLPHRIITSIAIDPADPRHVFVTLGSSTLRPYAPAGALGNDGVDLHAGSVYESLDAGQTFTDVERQPARDRRRMGRLPPPPARGGDDGRRVCFDRRTRRRPVRCPCATGSSAAGCRRCRCSRWRSPRTTPT